MPRRGKRSHTRHRTYPGRSLHFPDVLRNSDKYALSRQAAFQSARDDRAVRHEYRRDVQWPPDRARKAHMGGLYRLFNATMMTGIALLLDPSECGTRVERRLTSHSLISLPFWKRFRRTRSASLPICSRRVHRAPPRHRRPSARPMHKTRSQDHRAFPCQSQRPLMVRGQRCPNCLWSGPKRRELAGRQSYSERTCSRKGQSSGHASCRTTILDDPRSRDAFWPIYSIAHLNVKRPGLAASSKRR